MKVGDYVRTIYGIAKIENISCGEDLWFDNDNIFEDEETAHNYRLNPPSMYGSWAKDNIIKSSPSIIDLIEIGDYVNGGKVYEKEKEYIVINADFGGLFEFINVYEEDIKSIVTKEMYSSVEYRVEIN